MVQGNIYDRISQRREAAELLARQQAEASQTAMAAQDQADLAAAAAPCALQPDRNGLRIAGLELLMPQGFMFRDLETTLEWQGEQVRVTARRRVAPQGLSLDKAIELFIQKLQERHADFVLVRTEDTRLGGHPAAMVDYLYGEGRQRTHGRAVCALVIAPDLTSSQWLDISTLVDPANPVMSQWLTQFESMLANVSA